METNENYPHVYATDIECPYTILDYSDKAFAVVGETKRIKDMLKANGGRFNFHLSCGAGWIFPKSKLNDVKALLSKGNFEVTQSNAAEGPTKEAGNAYIDALTEFAETKAQKQYFLKNYICAVKIGDKFLLIEKPKIETNFCFSDEGAQYEQYQELYADAEKMKKYFVSENLKRFSSYINAVVKGENLYLDDCYNDNSIAVHTYCARDMQKADAETCMAIKEACEYAKEKTLTRLNTYLKKYGVSKLRVWTYWANR